MSLYWPPLPAQVETGKPRLHALVIGVGDYPHLMGGAGHPAVVNFGLQQLTTTTFTAVRIAEWLATEYNNLACPLGSIELLLSPGQQLTRPDGSTVQIDVSSMNNIQTAFSDWYLRCHGLTGNIAFFYFAGHGLSTASQYLLASDFGSPAFLNLWRNAIDFDGLQTGMRANNADTQLFFVDACREAPIDALLQLNPSGDSLAGGATIFDQVTSSAAYYAAADGLQAYGPATGITFFATALLDSLSGAGALNKAGKWAVDTFSLGNSLGQIMDQLAFLHNQPLTCNPDPRGKVAMVHCPPSAIVRTSIGCQSDAANAECEILLKRGTDAFHSQAGQDRPWTGRLRPGDWDIELKFQNFATVMRKETLTPPVFDLEEPI